VSEPPTFIAPFFGLETGELALLLLPRRLEGPFLVDDFAILGGSFLEELLLGELSVAGVFAGEAGVEFVGD